MTATQHRAAAPYSPHPQPWRTWGLALAAGACVSVLLAPFDLSWPGRAFAGWDVAVLVVLGHIWWVILRSDAARSRARAAREDPGRLALLAIAILASVMSLVAATDLLRRTEEYVPPAFSWLFVGVGLVAVAGGWALMHSAFALHYAHLYYRGDGTPAGLEIKGGEPDDLDFAYFAFTIGMTFQTSDVTITAKELRRAALVHAVLAFAFNTVILALAVNLIVGRL